MSEALTYNTLFLEERDIRTINVIPAVWRVLMDGLWFHPTYERKYLHKQLQSFRIAGCMDFVHRPEF
jgi:hypothetical protein